VLKTRVRAAHLNAIDCHQIYRQNIVLDAVKLKIAVRQWNCCAVFSYHLHGITA